ncbi:MAG: hypothetical protein N3B13_01000 [Deltaproteobacteria bacterium]|nr:hypothetical protein [Deltaproteobacteria bacterium]
MWEYLKLHEEFIRGAIKEIQEKEKLLELRDFHMRQITFMQHERLIHLIVTMFVALFTIMSFGLCYFAPAIPTGLLSLLFVILTGAYILHYFRLENGVQRWYHIANELEHLLGHHGARYENHKIEKNR